MTTGNSSSIRRNWVPFTNVLGIHQIKLRLPSVEAALTIFVDRKSLSCGLYSEITARGCRSQCQRAIAGGSVNGAACRLGRPQTAQRRNRAGSQELRHRDRLARMAGSGFRYVRKRSKLVKATVKKGASVHLHSSRQGDAVERERA